MSRERQRGVYVTAKQKKKLIELMTKHPELVSYRISQDFTQKDSQKLWHNISNECNSLPGARKTWRQWRKTWQDLKSKTKKRHAETNGEMPSSIVLLTKAEQEVLGLKNVSSTTNYQEHPEFIPIDDNNTENFDNEHTEESHSEDVSESDEAIEIIEKKIKKEKNKNQGSKHSECAFNCELLAIQEAKKLQIKEAYFNFKMDYLKEKLKIMKEQSAALITIAKELGK